jgi:putative inorganic carbon (HCO3(-)) transporter
LFWQDRLVEGGLVLSMALYYIVANPKVTLSRFLYLNFLTPLSHLNPLFSLPFLLIFAVLCWYRLPFAVALLPFSLPYYLVQKVVFVYQGRDFAYSLVEITLVICLVVSLLQLAFKRRSWPFWLSWPELRDRIGPFLWPILVFFAAAAFSIVIAYQHVSALRAFLEEVLDPLLYLVLALVCLRTRLDLTRLLASLLGSALIIALLAIVQYFFFKNTLVLESDGIRRAHTVYGSANSIGLLLDYTLPLGLTWLLMSASWRNRLIAGGLCLPLVIALYLSQSHGAWIAIAVAALFVVALNIRNRTLLLIGALTIVVALLVAVIAFHRAFDFVFEGHTNAQGVSTLSRRLYLWESAWNMIRDYPWFGVGMDNWLCYYSNNPICNAHKLHYWIVNYPPNRGTDTGLRDEPTLSHPHNIFLHVWVSMGIFGLLAFIAVLVLFYRVFARILYRLRYALFKEREHLRWMTIGIGAAMLAALVQGLGDSAFLEQDLAFCFWMLVTALMLIRMLSDTPWSSRKGVPWDELSTRKIPAVNL